MYFATRATPIDSIDGKCHKLEKQNLCSQSDKVHITQVLAVQVTSQVWCSTEMCGKNVYALLYGTRVIC